MPQTSGSVCSCPLAPHTKGQGVVSNKRLTAKAHWVWHHLLGRAFAESQLSVHGPTEKSLPASLLTGDA